MFKSDDLLDGVVYSFSNKSSSTSGSEEDEGKGTSSSSNSSGGGGGPQILSVIREHFTRTSPTSTTMICTRSSIIGEFISYHIISYHIISHHTKSNLI